MKKIILILLLSASLVGCDRIAGLVFSKLEFGNVETSSAQDLKAHQIYNVIKNKDATALQELVSPELRVEFERNQQVFGLISEQFPAEAATNMNIINIQKIIEMPDKKMQIVDYLYEYPSCKVRLRIAFKGHDGGDDVVGLHILQLSPGQQACKTD